MALLVVIVVVIGLWLAHPSGDTTGASARTCQTIRGTLANGPDPGADPIGYAQAQIDPLREIATSDAGLKSALSSLSAAYAAFVSDGGSKSSRRAVTSASTRLAQYCPGAAS